GADVEVGVGVDGGEGERFGHRWIGSGGARGHYSDSSTNFGNTGSGFGSGVPGSSGNATAANDRGSTSASASPPAAASATFGARPAEASAAPAATPMPAPAVTVSIASAPDPVSAAVGRTFAPASPAPAGTPRRSRILPAESGMTGWIMIEMMRTTSIVTHSTVAMRSGSVFFSFQGAWAEK